MLEKAVNAMLHDALECLVTAVETREYDNEGHGSRVADMSVQLAMSIGVQGEELEAIHLAAHLHDIGKIAVPGGIINKAEPLQHSEWEMVKQHPLIGYNILTQSNLLVPVATIVLHHHERWDGSGYPHRLEGRDIPLGSRIIAICDAIDAMSSQRPYRPALCSDDIFTQIYSNQGLQFDPDLSLRADLYALCRIAADRN